jgi:predicted nucleic acid-binding protein
MNSAVCVDANVIVRTLVFGPFSAQATALLAQWQQAQRTLLAPALFTFEVTSTLRRLVYHQAITPAEGDEAFTRFLRLKVRLSHRRSLFPLAWQLAQQFNRSRAYDTAYLALAHLNQCDFWTADEKLFNAVRQQLPWVKWVGNTASLNGAEHNEANER